MKIINKKEMIAFIPARGGSKTIRNKNLKKINRKSLVEITLKLAVRSKLFSSIVLSSNSKKILKYGLKFKNVSNILRPNSISLDNSKTDDSIMHYLKNNKHKAKYLVILQVTSPLRKVVTLKRFVKHCLKKKLKNCLTVTHRIDQVSKFGKYFKPLESSNYRLRQKRKGFLVENGLLYFIRIADFLKSGKIYSKNWNYFITDEYESIDINNNNDLNIVRKIL